MSTKFLKFVKEILTVPLAIKINETLETGIFPANIKIAR